MMYRIEQKGITFDHDLVIRSPFLLHSFLGGKRKGGGGGITKVVVKSHAFLLDRCIADAIQIF